jgi:hypothetical protein
MNKLSIKFRPSDEAQKTKARNSVAFNGIDDSRLNISDPREYLQNLGKYDTDSSSDESPVSN